jgi:hypothetical protein
MDVYRGDWSASSAICLREAILLLCGYAPPLDLSIISPKVCWRIEMCFEVFSTDPTSKSNFSNIVAYAARDHVLVVLKEGLNFCGKIGKLQPAIKPRHQYLVEASIVGEPYY